MSNLCSYNFIKKLKPFDFGKILSSLPFETALFYLSLLMLLSGLIKLFIQALI